MDTTDTAKKVHHGKNIRRFREMFGMKQEALAIELGEDWSQRKVSRLEENEVVEDDILDQIAQILKIPKEAIKNFTEEAAVNIISNTFTDNQFAGYTINNHPTFNPLDKLIEVMEENKK